MYKSRLNIKYLYKVTLYKYIYIYCLSLNLYFNNHFTSSRGYSLHACGTLLDPRTREKCIIFNRCAIEIEEKKIVEVKIVRFSALSSRAISAFESFSKASIRSVKTFFTANSPMMKSPRCDNS